MICQILLVHNVSLVLGQYSYWSSVYYTGRSINFMGQIWINKTRYNSAKVKWNVPAYINDEIGFLCCIKKQRKRKR